MISVTGSIKRAFLFPADPHTAIAYYSDLTRITQHMPHINLVEVYSPTKVRVRYETVELSSYTIRIFCDLKSIVEPDERMLTLLPLEEYPPVEPETSVNTTTGHGLFALQAHFHDAEGQTRIEYEIQLKASPPRPLGMRLMPRRVVNRIAQNITDSRIREIADGFIESTLAAFPIWQAENELAG